MSSRSPKRTVPLISTSGWGSTRTVRASRARRSSGWTGSTALGAGTHERSHATSGAAPRIPSSRSSAPAMARRKGSVVAPSSVIGNVARRAKRIPVRSMATSQSAQVAGSWSGASIV